MLGAYLAWALICAEVMFAAGKSKDMPAVFAKVNKNNVPVVALWVTSIIIQLIVISTYWSRDAFSLMLNLTSATTLIPYLFVAAYGLMIAQRGETYEVRPEERKRDLILASLAVLYTLFMIYAGGLKFILLSAVLFGPGTVLYVWARREQGKAVFDKTSDWVIVRRHRGRCGLRHLRHRDRLHQHLITSNGGHHGRQESGQVEHERGKSGKKDVKFGVHSEVGQLRKVMVCAPGRAHSRLTPSNCDQLLFDDVLWVENAKRDHFDFMHQDARPRHRGGRDAQPAGRDGGGARGQEVDPRQPGRARTRSAWASSTSCAATSRASTTASSPRR